MDRNLPSHASSLPNLLTASRIAAAPLLAFAVLTAQSPWLAAVLVLFAALTDFLDGAVARASGWRPSAVGAVLDPIADKIFVVTALTLLLADGVLKGASVWAVLIIVWRELLISVLRDYARLQGFRAPASFLAKVKTAMQFLCVILLFAARIPLRNEGVIFAAGIHLLWAAAALSLYTGADYLWHAWRQTWK